MPPPMTAQTRINTRPVTGWNFASVGGLLVDLLRPGLLGIYNHVSVYEVFGVPRGQTPINILSVAIVENLEGLPEGSGYEILTEKRIRVDGFPNWSFGVARFRCLIKDLNETLAAFESGQGWALSGKQLEVGPLEVETPMFVAPNGTQEVPINRLLKNNFWSGSYVIRLCDPNKAALSPFVDDRRRLQALSAAISTHMPIALAGMVDFLGDILIQIPVTAVIVKIVAPKKGGPMEVKAVWHPSVPPRNLRAAARMRSDAALTGAAFSESFTESTSLVVNSHEKPVEVEVWDEETGILVAATAPTSTLSQIAYNIHIVDPEPRVFTSRDAEGAFTSARIQLFQATPPTFVGISRETSADRWHSRRNALEEARQLEETRNFVQYRPSAVHNAEHARAIEDIRFLINAHGESGIDLWDPYLAAEDLLQTLFWSPSFGARLRALTDGREVSKCSCKPSSNSSQQPGQKKSFAERQRDVLTHDCGNLRGLQLEYRTRYGPEGWAFHDRFLIFPNLPAGPAAWSLGTSINSIGKAHHILQRVSNSALVAGAFEDLWGELTEPQHLVWRSW